MFNFLKEKIKGFLKESKKDLDESKKTEKEDIEKAEKAEKPIKFPKKKKEKEKITEQIVEQTLETVEKEEKSEGFFDNFRKKFTSISIDEKEIDNINEKLELALLENNVALEVVDKIKENMKKELTDKEIERKNFENEIKKIIRDSIEKILIEPFDVIEKIKENKDDGDPFVIAFFGINGSGKTTTIAKFAHLAQKNHISCVLAAGDTFRAASIEQLSKHGDNLKIKVIKQQYGSDPAAVAFDAIEYAKSHHIDLVLIDTAGRMHTKENLLREMEKIVRVSKPNLKIFVGESITGNDATEQAKKFNEAIDIDGMILSKADVDEKGGTALSVSYVTGKPILYLGTGQGYDNLEKFNKAKILENLGLD